MRWDSGTRQYSTAARTASDRTKACPPHRSAWTGPQSATITPKPDKRILPMAKGTPGASRTHPPGNAEGSHPEAGRCPDGRRSGRDPCDGSATAHRPPRPDRAGPDRPLARSGGRRARIGHAGRLLRRSEGAALRWVDVEFRQDGSARALGGPGSEDLDLLSMPRDILSDSAYAPVATGNADEIRAKKPSLASLDLILPGTDGIELMKRVPALADLPVIFISAYGRDETIAKALESGAADYIVKPFWSTELMARVQAALRAQARSETFVHGELAIDFG